MASESELDEKGWPSYEELKAQLERVRVAPFKTSFGWMPPEKNVQALQDTIGVWRRRIDELTTVIDAVRYVLDAEAVGGITTTYPSGHSPMKRLRDAYNAATHIESAKRPGRTPVVGGEGDR